MTRFVEGNTVRLKTGRSLQKVLDVKIEGGIQYVFTAYYSSLKRELVGVLDQGARWRKSSDFSLELPPTLRKYLRGEWNEEQPMTENLLYQTKGNEPLFGTHIATDSKGRFVLEMKGSGNVLAFEEKDIEVVTPYTVQLDPLIKNDGSQVHVLAEEGQVEKGDVLLEMNSGKFWRVVVVGSKSRSPRPNISKWMKIPTEAISFGVKP